MLQLEAELARLREELVEVRSQALDAVAATHRQYRRDLVPVRQARGALPRAPLGSVGVVRRGGDTTKSNDTTTSDTTTSNDQSTKTVKRGTGACR